jgi:hypothetical protein
VDHPGLLSALSANQSPRPDFGSRDSSICSLFAVFVIKIRPRDYKNLDTLKTTDRYDQDTRGAKTRGSKTRTVAFAY